MLNFSGEYEAIPVHLRGSIERYVENRIQPGGFMTAVLKNDLYNATCRADPESLKALPLIVRWFANNRPNLYGPDNFKNHMESKAA